MQETANDQVSAQGICDASMACDETPQGLDPESIVSAECSEHGTKRRTTEWRHVPTSPPNAEWDDAQESLPSRSHVHLMSLHDRIRGEGPRSG